ncbi:MULTISPECIES: hypothetical protein [unclassified Sporolactobacillus]|nr:hypothetical protein [Sporolactobacillus sp. CQH2019]MDD9148601.1 hypothetical protein [Sporolactobacillus sp. CQH2019]
MKLPFGGPPHQAGAGSRPGENAPSVIEISRNFDRQKMPVPFRVPQAMA